LTRYLNSLSAWGRSAAKRQLHVCTISGDSNENIQKTRRKVKKNIPSLPTVVFKSDNSDSGDFLFFVLNTNGAAN
jgi:hypothetical protein